MFNRCNRLGAVARRSLPASAASSWPAAAAPPLGATTSSLRRPVPAIILSRPMARQRRKVRWRDHGQVEDATAKQRQTGTVKWFDDERGFGFIVPDDPGAPEVFVHRSNIRTFGTLAEGDQVKFEVVSEKGKRKAIHVTGPETGPSSDDPLAKEWLRQIHNPWKRCRPCHDIQAVLPVCEKHDICSIDQRCILKYHEEGDEW